MRDQRDRIFELVGEVYDAALDARLWSGLAPRIAQTFEATSLGLTVTAGPKAHWVARTANIDDAAAAAYEAHFNQCDVWAQRAAHLGLSTVLASKDLISDQDFERTEFCNDYCRRVESFYVVGSVFPLIGDEIAVWGVHRPRDAGNFDDDDKRLTGLLLPHMQRALQLRSRLADIAAERDAAFEALDRSATATLVVAGDGALLYANPGAERLLKAGDGLCAVRNRVAAADGLSSERLAALVRGAADTAAGRGDARGGPLAIPRLDRLPLTLLVAPFRPARDGFGAPLPAAILFVRDPEAPTAACLALQGLFGLTPAEAKIASALAEGKSTGDIIEAFGISANTVRTHLKSVFGKTGVTQQSQLVALVLRSVAVLG